MGKLTTLEPTQDQAAWIDRGRALVRERTEVDWRIADWIGEGRAKEYATQAQFDFLAAELGVAPRALRIAAKVAEAFPPSQRSTALPYDVHAHLATLPADERLPALQRAATEGWTERDAKTAVVEHRHQAAMFDDEDAETRLAVEIIRAWNRAPVESRRYAFELMDAHTFAAIDEDQAHA